jgi:type VII secretion-associated serine protease mycosin
MLSVTRTARRVLLGAATALLLAVAPALPAAAAPADAVRDQQQWVLSMLDTTAAWRFTEGSGVTVAVIDSGVDPNVSDLTGSVKAGPDYTGLNTSPHNPAWGEHGTWMASIIAGHGHDYNNEDGIYGIAPQATILSIRVIPDKGDPGYQAYNAEPEERIQQELAAGIRTAVRDGATVISMSIGYSAPSGAVRDAIQYAYSRGVVLVASSGNSGDNDTQHAKSGPGLAPVSFPAEYPGVISVGAVDSKGAPTAFSSGNLSVRVAAPGKGVPAEGRNGLYYTVDGTSPACALVAGVAALIKSRYPKISPALVTQALTGTAKQDPAGGYDVLTGFGIVDAGAALARAGQLMTEKAQGSAVAATAHFGGGATAVPAAPVPARGLGGLVTFIVVALLAATALAAGCIGLARAGRPGRRRREGQHAA